jgi:hypothetical protein
VTKRSLCIAGYVGQLIACITGAGDVDCILGTVAGNSRVVRHLFCVLSQRPNDDSSEYDCAVFQVAVRCVWMLCRSPKAENFLKWIGVEKWFECLGEIVNLTISSIDTPEWAMCFSKTLHVVARCALVLSEPEWCVFSKVARKDESLLNAFYILFCRKGVIQCAHLRNEAICRLAASLIHTLTLARTMDAFEVIDSLIRDQPVLAVVSDWICAVEPVEEGVILTFLLLMCLSIMMGQKIDKNLRIGVFVKANAFIESFPHSSIIIRYATHLMMLSSDRIIKIEEVVRFLPKYLAIS